MDCKISNQTDHKEIYIKALEGNWLKESFQEEQRESFWGHVLNKLIREIKASFRASLPPGAYLIHIIFSKATSVILLFSCSKVFSDFLSDTKLQVHHEIFPTSKHPLNLFTIQSTQFWTNI